jgi:hypothetical protein
LVSGGIFVIVIEEFEADGVLGLFLRTFDGLHPFSKHAFFA